MNVLINWSKMWLSLKGSDWKMIKFTQEYIKIAKLFKNTFNYGVPLAMLPKDIDMDELIDNIKLCVETNKDNLLSIYGVSTAKDELM